VIQIKLNQFNSDTNGPYLKEGKREQTEKRRQTDTHKYFN